MSKGKILIVDDKKLLRDSLKEFLEASDYEVFEAETGEIAINFLQNRDVDLVLMDEILPGIGGLQTLQLIKKLKENLVILGLSGEITVKLIEDYLGAGAYDILAKSAIYQKLLPLVEEAIASAAPGRKAESVDYIKEAENLKKHRRWEEAAVYLKEAGMEAKLLGQAQTADAYFLDAIKCLTRAGRINKAKEIETLITELPI